VAIRGEKTVEHDLRRLIGTMSKGEDLLIERLFIRTEISEAVTFGGKIGKGEGSETSGGKKGQLRLTRFEAMMV
jgi:hypothetical protein